MRFQNFPAENLIKGDSFKKWKCAAGDKNATVTLQVVKFISTVVKLDKFIAFYKAFCMALNLYIAITLREVSEKLIYSTCSTVV